MKKFDVIVNGFLQAVLLKEESFKNIMNDGCIIYQESADYVVALERSKRKDVKNFFKMNGVKLGLTNEFSEKTHHVKFKYDLNKENPVNNSLSVSGMTDKETEASIQN